MVSQDVKNCLSDILALESGNTVTGAISVDDVIWTVTMGAGSALSPIM